MNTISERSLRPINWSPIVMFTLGFWLSGSLIIDLIIIPSLSAAGMMNQTGFASAGYLLFGIFNRIELVCAALVLTGFLIFCRHHTLSHSKQSWSIPLAGFLFAIAFIDTYLLTPQLSAWGLQLSLFEAVKTMPSVMISLHEGYWVLEAAKLLIGTTLLRWCYRESCSLL
jgi:hypothetical protein